MHVSDMRIWALNSIWMASEDWPAVGCGGDLWGMVPQETTVGLHADQTVLPDGFNQKIK